MSTGGASAGNGNQSVLPATNNGVQPTAEDERKFSELLKELTLKSVEPTFHSKSKWQDLCENDRFKLDSRFKIFSYSHQHLQTAHDIFERYCWDINDKLIDPKQKIKQLFKSQNYSISPSDTV
eukprot:308605_1